jgi:DNA repair exonuclease SbcCD ATPase subunit
MNEIEKMKQQLESKTAYANELMAVVQEKEGAIRRHIEERKKLNEAIEDLRRKLDRAENRTADRERDHYILMDAMKLLARAWAEGADLADEVEAALDIGDPKSSILPRLQEYRTYVAQARQMASDSYALKVQERMLLQIWKKGELTQELRDELGRFMEEHKQTMRDADNWAEVEEAMLRAGR